MSALRRLRAANQQRQREWDPRGVLTPEFLGCELAGEAGEACNVVKKLVRADLGFPGSRASVRDLAKELADVIIVADLIAAKYEIDLEEAIREKFNETSEKLRMKTLMVPDMEKIDG